MASLSSYLPLSLPLLSPSLPPSSEPFINSFCSPEFNGSWASLPNELGAFTPCFIDIIILGSAHLTLFVLALARLHVLFSCPLELRMTLGGGRKAVQLVASGLAAGCGVVPLMQLSARESVDIVSGNEPLAPFEIVSLVLSSLAWFSTFFALFREIRYTTPNHVWYIRFPMVFVLVGQLAKLQFVFILKANLNSFFVILFLVHTGAQILLGLYAVLFYPYGTLPVINNITENNLSVSENTHYSILPDSPPDEKICPEYSVDFFSRISFHWLTPLMQVGRKRPLQDSDVWKLHPSDTSDVVSQRFKVCWDEEKLSRNPWLLKSIHSCFGRRFWLGGLFKIGNDASQFVGPVMLNRLLGAMQSLEPSWHGYVYASAIFFGLAGGVLCEAQYFQNVMRVGFQLRQALVASVFRKSLLLSHRGRQNFSSGRIVNMMTSDTETLQTICQQLHNLWSAPLRILVCMLLLYKQLGVASIVGLGVLLLLIPIQAFIMNNQQRLVKQSLQKADKRIELMNEVLSSMDSVKCYTWEESFKKKVSTVRKEELGRLRLAQYIMATNFFLLNIIPVLVTVVGFGVYSLLGGNLTPSKAFTSISLFSVLRMPLYTFPQLITQVVQSNVSLKRLQEMLLADERLLEPPLPIERNEPSIEIKGSSFSWTSQTEKSTLQEINLTVERGSLVAIVGGTGQGKSSLLSSLLGEISPILGNREAIVRGTTSYVAQVAWIFNATVRDNILFGLPFDTEKYLKSIKVSALERDFELLPGGDLTEIGERGVNVSGGQKQRISIARAVYAQSDNYIFDDPLSALDAHVAKQVFETCVIGALRGKTRVMATNQLHFLPHVDKVVVIHEGRIVEQGTYEKLKSEGPFFQELMKQAGSMEGDETEGGGGGGGGGGDKASSKNATNGSATAVVDGNVAKNGGEEGEKEKEKEKKAETKIGTALIKAEERETGVVNIAVIWRYVKAMGGSSTLGVLMILFLGIEISRIWSSAWVSIWSGAEQLSEGAPHPVKYYIMGYALICFLQVFLTFANQFWLVFASLRAAKKLHESMLNSILRAPMLFFHSNPLGRLINRFTKDTADIDKTLAQYTSLCLGAIFQLFSTFAVIGYLNTIALWAIVPLFLAFYFVYLYFQSTAREVKRLDAVTRSPVYAQFGEALNGISTIRAYRAQDRMAVMNGKAMDRNTRYSLVNMSSNRWLGIRLEFLGGLMITATAMFAVMNVQKASDQAAMASTMGLILSYALTITMIMTMVLRLGSLAENSFNAVERVGTYSDIPPEAPPIIDSRRPPPDWPTKGEISFEEVVMRYRLDLPPVLRGLTARIGGGEKVGVVGRTGAGKSSLFNALFRITEIESGKIFVDGYDLSLFGLTDVRRALMIIPQTPVLFTGTIRFNLDPFEEHSDIDVWEALARAHLHEVIRRLPLGLETEVTEGGDNFSVGQRQLISLARALLKRAKILVLDEATAAVDVGTDALIQKTIREEFKDCTMLIIAHRLNTIIDSDRILVMDAGLALEYDSPSNLLSDESTLFSGMVRSTGAGNAKYLMKVARGEVRVTDELAASASATKQKWANQATARMRWSGVTSKALNLVLQASQSELQKVCPSLEGSSPTILDRVREATSTLQEVLSGEHNEELEKTLLRAYVDEKTWWSAFFRVMQGLSVIGRQLQSQLGSTENSQEGLPWNVAVTLGNGEHQGE